MKKLLLSLLLLPTFLQAAETEYTALTQCGNGQWMRNVNTCGASGDENCCPPNLTAPGAGANVVTNAFDGSVTTDKKSGTIHGCSRLASADKRTPTEIVAGTGCTSKQTVTVTAAGLQNFNTGTSARFIGASAGTEYQIDYYHVWDGDEQPGNVVSQSFEFSTIAGGVGLETQGSRFLGTGGSDSNDGLTHATRWLTLDKVNSTALPAGTNIYGLAGTVSEDAQLFGTWTGTSNDPVIVATYCDNLGTPIAYDSGNGACSAGKWEINGTLEQACREANPPTCPMGNQPTASIPAGFNGALIQLNDGLSDWTIRDIKITDSSARGVTANFHTRLIIDNVDFGASAFQWLVNQDSVNHEIRDNFFTEAAYCEHWSKASGLADHPEATYIAANSNCYDGGQPSGVAMSVKDGSSYSVVENNFFQRSGGEIFNHFRTDNVAILGNKFAGGGLAIHGDQVAGMIAMGNIFLGNTDDDFADNGQDGIDLALENAAYTGGNNIIAHNVFAGGAQGIQWRNISLAARNACTSIGGYVYGNTIAGTTNLGMGINAGIACNIGEAYFVNNLALTTQGNDCLLNAAGASEIDLMDHNGFLTGGPDDTDCNDADNQTDSWPFAQNEAWFTGRQTDDLSSLTLNDFKLPSGASNFKANGTLAPTPPSWVSDLLNNAGWNDITIEWCGGLPSNLNTDAECNTRINLHMGALDSNL